jgi:hypothetical protein
MSTRKTAKRGPLSLCCGVGRLPNLALTVPHWILGLGTPGSHIGSKGLLHPRQHLLQTVDLGCLNPRMLVLDRAGWKEANQSGNLEHDPSAEGVPLM